MQGQLERQTVTGRETAQRQRQSVLKATHGQ